MKKTICYFLLIAVLLLSACRTAEAEPNHAMYFYYPREEISYNGGTALMEQGSALDPETVEPRTLMNSYLSAPLPEGALPVLPADWHLIDLRTEEDTVRLVFGGTAVAAAQSSMTCVCLTKTLLQLPTVRSVSISMPGSTEPVTLTANDILLSDSGMLPQEEQVVLYFPDAQRRYLLAQSISISEEESADKPGFILSKLLEQPDSSCIPAGTRLLSVNVENGVCTVNLSSEFIRQGFADFATERLAVYAIVNSLTELPEISTVDLWVAGAPVEKLGYLDLSSGLARDMGLHSVALGEDRLDIDLYPAVGDIGLLAPIPTVLELEADRNPVELLINELISYEGSNGLKNCLPQGTKLLSVRMEGSTCVLDFTGEFLAGCTDISEEMLAVRSVIATVCQLPEVAFVEILVEGIEPAYRDPALGRLRMPTEAWFVH